MGELLSDPQYSGQRSARFWELNSPSLKWAHVWQPKWTVHSSYLRVPTNPWPVSEGKGLTTRLKKGRRGSRTHELYLGHLWACQFSPTSHLLIFGRAQTLPLSSHSTRWKRENWSRSLGTRARPRRACASHSSLVSLARENLQVTRSPSLALGRARPGSACAEGRGNWFPVRPQRLRAAGFGPPGLRERSREDGGCGGKCSEAVSGRFDLS